MQQRFVEHYLVTLNAAKSARLAGYSHNNAGEQGYQLLRYPSISKALRKAMARRAKRLEITSDNILREIARIAFSDIRSIMEFDSNSVKVKDSSKIHSDAAAAIQSVEHHRTEGEKSSSSTVKVKLHDKIRALDLAGRHLGLWAKEDDDELKKMSLQDLILLLKQGIPELEAK